MRGGRFDDLAGGRSFSLVDLVTSYTAEDIDEVIGVLEQAAAASAEGYWVAGYVSYDAASAFDPALVAHRDRTIPLACFCVYRTVEVDEIGSDLPRGDYSVSRWMPLVERWQYDKSFVKIHEHIEAGDAYQVALTFPLRAAFSGAANGLYRDLVASQRPAYAAHLWYDTTHVVSVSPERFFQIEGRHITTRPMKGTRPRGRWLIEDEAQRVALAASEKDRAENLMIVDLIRNDLGRVGEFGSVAVDEMYTIEKYPTVWQMTSQISAKLRTEVTLVDVFEALFPCGSVTGTPKARAMEIIADVETYPRGIYCGAIGFIPPGDGLDGASFNVAIRSGVVDEDEGVVCYGVGGGITWSSNVDHEYDEALAKAMVLTAPRTPPGLIETIRWDDGWVWLDDHLERLAKSASFLGLEVPISDLRTALDELEAVLKVPSRVRVVVTGEGLSVNVEEAPVRFATGPGPDTEAITVAIDLDPIDARDPRLFHKTTDRSRYDARKRRYPDADEVLLTNEEGNITEGTITNVAVLIEGTWVTPPVGDGLLPGVMRRRLLDAGTIEERSISVPQAGTADAVAVFNSVSGWRPAVPITRPPP
jgi:para-aminobenzoate synthetase/4-amino-4-deoxychorismate lyase